MMKGALACYSLRNCASLCYAPCVRTSVCLQAAQRPKGSMERLLLVAAFAQSAFQAVGKLKAMVPIMGETYEVHLQQPSHCGCMLTVHTSCYDICPVWPCRSA